jgi:hypothetical protein
MSERILDAVAMAVRKVRENPAVVRNPDLRAMGRVMAGEIADACADSDDQFDRDRFFALCGMPRLAK